MRTVFLALILLFPGVSAWAVSSPNSVVDHVRKVSSSSASDFRGRIYKNVLLANYSLTAHSYRLASSELFRAVRGSEPLLREFVSERILELCRSRGVELSRCDAARVDALSTRDYWVVSPDEQSQAFAGWLFALDGDNWFRFEDAAAETGVYLAGVDRELVMFPSFNPDGILVDLLSSNGLPVVVDSSEETITIWTNELAD
jgi:hypothetical protein